MNSFFCSNKSSIYYLNSIVVDSHVDGASLDHPCAHHQPCCLAVVDQIMKPSLEIHRMHDDTVHMTHDTNTTTPPS